MAILSASAKLYTGIRCWCVDKNISAALTASFSIGNRNRPASGGDTVFANVLAFKLRRAIADLVVTPSLSLTNQRLKTFGGGNTTPDGYFILGRRYTISTLGSTDWNAVAGTTGVTYVKGSEFTSATAGAYGTGKAQLQSWTVKSTVVCKFPTYFRIDVDKLQLPQGTTCTVSFEEDWIKDGIYLESTKASSPAVGNFFTFRTPWLGASFINSSFTLPNKTGLRIKQLGSNVSSLATVTAYPIFNPGKLAALFGGVFLTTPNVVKRVRGASAIVSSFASNTLNLKIKQLASTFTTTISTLTGDAIKYKTPGVVAMPTTATLSASVDRNIGVINSFVADAATMTITATKVARSTPAITVTASVSAGVKVTLGLIQNITATSSLSISGSLAMVFETTANTFNVPILYGSANCSIEWGDGTSTTVTSPNGSWISHSYSSPYGTGVTKQVKISGYVQHLGYATMANVPQDSNQYNAPNNGAGNALLNYYYAGSLTKIVSFGDLGTETFVCAFANARYVTSVPTRLPSTVTDISRMFWHTVADDQFQSISNVGSWNVSNVTKMEGTFIRNRNGFNPNLSSWNVSNVTTMKDLFVFCDSGFNSDITAWDTGSVQNFQRTFYNASQFNQNIGNWDTSSATNMNGMFENAFSFNQDLSGWCVTNIPTAPSGANIFANTAILPGYKWPVWGTCPP